MLRLCADRLPPWHTGSVTGRISTFNVIDIQVFASRTKLGAWDSEGDFQQSWLASLIPDPSLASTSRVPSLLPLDVADGLESCRRRLRGVYTIALRRGHWGEHSSAQIQPVSVVHGVECAMRVERDGDDGCTAWHGVSSRGWSYLSVF